MALTHRDGCRLEAPWPPEFWCVACCHCKTSVVIIDANLCILTRIPARATRTGMLLNGSAHAASAGGGLFEFGLERAGQSEGACVVACSRGIVWRRRVRMEVGAQQMNVHAREIHHQLHVVACMQVGALLVGGSRSEHPEQHSLHHPAPGS